MKLSTFAIAAASLAIIGQAQAAHARVAYICPKLTGSDLQVEMKSGCVSTSSTLTRNDLAIKVDQQHAMIVLSGNLTYESRSIRATADCMGSHTIPLSAQGIETRRYSVLFNDELVGIADFLSDPAPKECLIASGGGSLKEESLVNLASYSDWNDNPFDGWENWRSSSVIDLLGPALSGFPEEMEGRTSSEISIEKQHWTRRSFTTNRTTSNEPFIGVSITQHGYLDDSVSGGRFFAAARQDEDGEWKLERFWTQNMCARGPNAGQWTADSCP